MPQDLRTPFDHFLNILTQDVTLPESLLEIKNPKKKAFFFFLDRQQNYVDMLIPAVFPITSPLLHWDFEASTCWFSFHNIWDNPFLFYWNSTVMF